MAQVTAAVTLALGTDRLKASFSVPEEPIAPVDLLPIARAIVEKIIQSAVANLPAGKEISCKAGCGACCRQLVPISPTEAGMLALMVRDMPEPHRSKVAARFQAAEEKLMQTGMWDVLRDRANWAPEDVARRGREYFHLGIPCPFLEDEACSIHAERPLSCREYLVTSDPAHCAAIRGESIDQVTLPLKVSVAINQMSPTKEGAVFHPWVPLTLIFDWALSCPQEPTEKPGPELVDEFFKKLALQQPVASCTAATDMAETGRLSEKGSGPLPSRVQTPPDGIETSVKTRGPDPFSDSL